MSACSMSILNLLPNHRAALELEPEELAGVILHYLAAQGSASYQLNLVNFISQNAAAAGEDVQQALIEAWAWLEREGLIAPKPGAASWFFVTRRGRGVSEPDKLAAYRKGNLLPQQRLHPLIAQKVWATFLRGDYDTAVFQAFKELEVRVRTIGGFGAIDVGVELMRKAFRPGSGPLSDASTPVAEQESLMHLMAGAIGSYKNPHSHRNVVIDSIEAVEMILLASHLISIVDRRRSFDEDCPYSA